MVAVVATELEARLTEMEIRYSHLEHLTETLNVLVRQQAEELERLRQGMRLLHGRLESLGEEPTPHERPPHY